MIDNRSEIERLEEYIFLVRGLLNYHRRATTCITFNPDDVPEFTLAASTIDTYDQALAKSLELLEKEHQRVALMAESH